MTESKKMAERQAFISLKNHKENFENNPKPNNPKLLSKQVLDRINNNIRSKTNFNQWRNAKSVIDWFSNTREKKKHSFLIFDIVDFYPSISEHLLKLSLTYAMQFTTVSDEDIEINTHSRKTLLFDKNETWIKEVTPPCSMSQWVAMMEQRFANWLGFLSWANSHQNTQMTALACTGMTDLPFLRTWMQDQLIKPGRFSVIRSCPHLVFRNQCLGAGTKWCCVHTLST